ncbi:MAG: hypothetical protein ACP5O6_12840, partial [Candidatus Baltobacteraceae bacterium]
MDTTKGREGDNRAQLYAWRDGKQTPRSENAFEVGEALRARGVGWSTGFGALWVAGYFGDFAQRLADLAQIPGAPKPVELDLRALGARVESQRIPVATELTFRDLAAVVGTHAPLFASASLAREMGADTEWLAKDRRGFVGFAVPYLPAPQSYLASREDRLVLPCDVLLAHAATIGDDAKIETEVRERVVWTLIFE